MVHGFRAVSTIGFLWMALGSGVAAASGTSLRFYGNGVAAPDLDRVKILIDDVATNLPGPPADVGNADFTIEFWLKAAAADNTAAAVSCGNNINWINGNIVVDRDRFGQDRKFGLSIAGGKLVFGVSGDGSGDRTICGTSNVLDNLWHHIAIQRRRTDGQMSLYVDGALEAQADGPDGDISYPDDGVPCPNCCAGGNCNFSDPYIVLAAEKHDAGAAYPSYSGFLDEMRISNTLRYSSNFTRPSTPFTTDAETVALYDFDEGSGNLVADSSGASGGPSHGERRYGGSPAGPDWSTDTPFGTPGDADGDGLLDGDDECTVLLIGGQTTDRTKLQLAKLSDPPGQQKLSWSGTFVPAGSLPMAPHLNGVHLLLRDSGGDVLDVDIPAGLIGASPSTPCNSRDGWKVSGSTYTYANRSGFLDAGCSVGSQGIVKMLIKDRRATRGDVQFKITGKGGSYAPVTPPVSMQATMALAAQPMPGSASPEAIAGQCGEFRWAAPISFTRPAPYCSFSPASGTTRKLACVSP